MKVMKGNRERNGTHPFLHQLGFALSNSCDSQHGFLYFTVCPFLPASCTVLVFIVMRDYGQVFSNSTAQRESPERTGMEHEDIMPPDGARAVA